MRLVLGAACYLATLIAAPGAQAAQRYAAPEGKGSEPCAQAAPCSLKDAVTKAKGGEEVIIGAGTYSVGETALSNPGVGNLNVHGDVSGQMPKIVATSMPQPLFLREPGDRVSYLEVLNTHSYAGGFICGPKGQIERVRVVVSGENATGIGIGSDCVVRDSLVIADGENAAAIRAAGVNLTGVLRNVTAIATGSGAIGAGSFYGETISPGTYTLDLKNTIVSGESADLVAHSGEGFDGPGNIVVSNSSFDHSEPKGTGTVAEGSGNQKAPPLFVDAANGDYREDAGSPTIDAGVNDQLGALDLAGNPRVLGAAPDIGAFEFVPPAGELRSVVFKPLAFRAAKVGGAVISRRKKRRPPVGSTVIYNLSAPATVDFTLERAVKGRRVGGKCKKATKANRPKKKCAFYKPIKGGFSVTGTAPLNNSFRFSGRIEDRALKPGTYKLVGHCGTTLKRGLFKIVR